MKFSRKAVVSIIYFIFINFGCEFKRDSVGPDNEIRVICSKIDRDNVEHFLKMVFNDTLFTPEPEPFYAVTWADDQLPTILVVDGLGAP